MVFCRATVTLQLCNKRDQIQHSPSFPLRKHNIMCPHEKCNDLIAPGTLLHLGGKTLQLCATALTHGGSKNTEWRKQAELFARIRPQLSPTQKLIIRWCYEAMADSDKSTKGHPLSKMQVNKCVTQEFREDGEWNYRNATVPMRPSSSTVGSSSRCSMALWKQCSETMKLHW